MKIKNGITTIVIILSLIVLNSCKTSGGDDTYTPPTPKPQGNFSLISGLGMSDYSSLLGLTSIIKLTFTVSANNPIGGVITNFRFVIKYDAIPMLEINAGNYQQYSMSISSDTYIIGFSLMELITYHPYGYGFIGDIFGSTWPNNVDIYITVRDDNGYTHALSANSIYSHLSDK